MPPLNNYEELVPLGPNTRSVAVENCSCILCGIARLKLQDDVKHKKIHSNDVGAPAKNENSPVNTIKMCTKCFSMIGAGKPHICNKNSFNDNMGKFIQNKSPSTKSKLTCTLLKTTASDCQSSSRGGVLELKSGSKILPVKIGTPQESKLDPKFTHEDMKRVQTEHNLSDKTVK